MAFTGELEQLHIVDIIQLLNTTRKSGTLSVRGSRGESRFIFSSGYIVGASHLNDRIRIGSVLVAINAISREDLSQALQVQHHAGKNRKPLMTTLIELGKLDRDAASRALRKLIEMTLVDVIGWSKGTFTLDTDVITVSPECSYPLSKMEQEISLDAQMILMDALRIYDERERDRRAGKAVTSDEDIFAEEISSESPVERRHEGTVLTEYDLGLSALDQLEMKIPQFIPTTESFEPLQIHRQKISEMLAGFPLEEQESFASFLDKSMITIGVPDGVQRLKGSAKALLLYSPDELIRYAVMTICKNNGVLVLTADNEGELDRTLRQCSTMNISPLLIFDDPALQEGFLSRDALVGLRRHVRETYPRLALIQMTSVTDFPFQLQSLREGVRAVFPRPAPVNGKASYIADTMRLLEALQSYVTCLFHEQHDLSADDDRLMSLKTHIAVMRQISEPSGVSLSLLDSFSGLCGRSIAFLVRQGELIGEKTVGVFTGRNAGPVPPSRLTVPLTPPSVFREAFQKGQVFYGEASDTVITEHLFDKIGSPPGPEIILLPITSRGKTVALLYGDSCVQHASPRYRDFIEILALEAGLVLENVLYRKQLQKTSQQ